MRIKVCSGWHPAGSAQYGRRFLETFDRYWPAAVELEVYVEQREPMPRDACRSLWDIWGAKSVDEFMQGNERFSGRDVQPDWKATCKQAGYNFRFDARKFWKQILIPGAAALDMADGDLLVWLDGDVVTTAPVPLTMVSDLIGEADVCYLGREPKHSEIGFWAVRINDATRAFLSSIANQYHTGEFQNLPEWHSAYVWDHVRRKFQMREANLCAPGARGHVWPNTSLAAYTRHEKGNRKPKGIR